ncbi:hypothetical protein O181_078160 [Austropuccinia psidii MF-1]|uniref:Uncharacterized protein n=1 Tax=Austropuccinia psidii MF-1 TaxID=1389203 RepID=A0A9Q3FJ89_9BASI|nr:hypothetical protein [Austropuccinia psidii MF-1]
MTQKTSSLTGRKFFTQPLFSLVELENGLNNISQIPSMQTHTAFSIAGKWIEPHLSHISNADPSCLLNSWKLFETQLFTLFGDLNEVRKAEQELDNLRMKESVHLSL